MVCGGVLASLEDEPEDEPAEAEPPYIASAVHESIHAYVCESLCTVWFASKGYALTESAFEFALDRLSLRPCGRRLESDGECVQLGRAQHLRIHVEGDGDALPVQRCFDADAAARVSAMEGEEQLQQAYAVLTGKRYAADDAIAAGFADDKAPLENLLSGATELATDLARKEPGIFKAIKQAYYAPIAAGLR